MESSKWRKNSQGLGMFWTLIGQFSFVMAIPSIHSHLAGKQDWSWTPCSLEAQAVDFDVTLDVQRAGVVQGQAVSVLYEVRVVDSHLTARQLIN